MLPRTYRLKKKKEFEILFKEGSFVGGKHSLLKIWKINKDKYPKQTFLPGDLKIGFVVGTKINKSAVKRNFVKRRMREVVRLLLKENRIKNGYLIAVVAKPTIVKTDYKEIENDITTLLRRAGVLTV